MTAPLLAPATAAENLRATGWLVLDMSLNIWALAIVKTIGAGYPAAQLVLVRALVGLALLAPWIWRERAAFARIDRPELHLLRMALAALALGASYHAIARAPMALFTAINFTRPILLMALAALLLGERIAPRRWVAAAAGLAGALVAIDGGGAAPLSGLVAMALMVIAGSGAVIVLRALRGQPQVVMMALYTAGLALCAAPFALADWAPVAPAHWPLLLAMGGFAQAAMLCFLRAHWLGDAGVLGPASYLGLLISGAVGFFVFAETPTATMLLGCAIIVAATLSLGR